MKKIFGILMIPLLALVGCNNNDNNTPVGGGQPAITSMTPNQVSIGQLDVVGTIIGVNLSGTTSVDMGAGIGVSSIVAKSAAELEIHFDVGSSASSGSRIVTVVTPAGSVSNAAVFSVSSNHVPIAVFKVEPAIGSLATVFTFDASSSTDTNAPQTVRSYQWDFGNGQTDNGKKVTKKFAAIGDYTVTLRVTDDKGGTDIASRRITVSKNTPPTPKFTVEPPNGNVNTTFVFDASPSSDPDGQISGYAWNFGDNAKATGVKVEHVYGKQGVFKATLTVTDNSQQAASKETAIIVERSTEIVCAGNGGNHQTIIKGRVIAVEAGNWAVVSFGSGYSCANTWHKCDDFRRLSPEGFYGIVDKMTDRGNGVLAVHNACPYRWPPAVGEGVFVYYKTCQQNHCP